MLVYKNLLNINKLFYINLLYNKNIAIYNHQQDYRMPDIVSYYTEGDIIGCDDKDNKLG